MDKTLEFHDSEVSGIEEESKHLSICFSHAYIYESGSGWSQKAKLILDDGTISIRPSAYPANISDGELHVEHMSYFNILELPFSDFGKCRVNIQFTNGEKLIAAGANPRVDLIGDKVFVEKVE